MIGDALPEVEGKAEEENEEDGCAFTFSDLPRGAVQLIFACLGPKDLCVTSAVCRCWREMNRDAAANKVWRELFSRRWRAPAIASSLGWQAQYGKKMRSAQAFGNRGLADVLYGHTAAVHTVCLLPNANLLATGSADQRVRLWDLQAGLPRSSSRPLKGTIRSLALDEKLLVGGGSQDGALRLWRAKPSLGDCKFDLAAPIRLRGHTGPVVSLSLDARNIYSGSWDCTVRIWSRGTLRRESLLAFPDWVNSTKPRGDNLLVTAGQVLYVQSLATGKLVSKYLHSALQLAAHWDKSMSTAPLQVDGSQDGRLVFMAGADGAIVALDLRAPRSPAAVLWAQNSPIRDLRYEDPWLAAAAYNGSVLLLDTDAILKGGPAVDRTAKQAAPQSGLLLKKQRSLRQRLLGPKGAVYSVDIADNWLACGSAESIVRTWDFHQAEKQPSRPSTAPRRPRGSARHRNRFPFEPGTDSSEEDGEAEKKEASDEQSCIPLSQSLPANLGGRDRRRSSAAGDSVASQHPSSENTYAESAQIPRNQSSTSDSDSPGRLGRELPRDCLVEEKIPTSICPRHSSGRFSVTVPLPVSERPSSQSSLGNNMEQWQRWQASRDSGRIYRQGIRVRG